MDWGLCNTGKPPLMRCTSGPSGQWFDKTFDGFGNLRFVLLDTYIVALRFSTEPKRKKRACCHRRCLMSVGLCHYFSDLKQPNWWNSPSAQCCSFIASFLPARGTVSSAAVVKQNYMGDQPGNDMLLFLLTVFWLVRCQFGFPYCWACSFPVWSSINCLHTRGAHVP